MLLLFITICFTFGNARPIRPPQREGEVRDFADNRKFSYDSTKLKRSTLSAQEPIMKYDIEMVDGYHSLDDEEIIEKVICTEETVDIFSTEKLEEWVSGDVFTGGEMWECQYDLMRRVGEIVEKEKVDGLYHYAIKTEKIQLKDLFKKADVDFHFPTEEELAEQEKSLLKRKSKYSVDIISPTEGTVVDTEIGLEVAYSIKGCTASDCGDITVQAKIYNDRTWPVSNELRTTHVAICGPATDYNCRYVIPMKGDGYEFDEENFIQLEFYKNGERIIKEEIDFVTNECKFIFELPLKGTVLSMNDPVNITWDVTSATLRKFETVKIQFYRQIDCWWDSKVASVTVRTDAYKLEYIVTEANGFEKGSTYYASVDLDNGEEYESFKFTISDGSDSIQVVTPDCATFVSKGEQLTIGWEYKNPLSNNLIVVRLVRGISCWPDDTVYEYEKIDSTNTEMTITLGDLKESTKYYIEIQYEAEGKKHFAYSDYFTYADKKYFTVTSSNTNEDTRVVTLNMKVNEYVGKYYMSIHQKFPVFSMLDYEIEGTQQKEITEYTVGQTYSQTFQYTQGSPFRAYVEFRYKCLYKDHMCEEEKYYINDIPYEESIFEWNYNSLTKSVADRSIDIAKYDCNNGVNTQNVGPSFKDICNKVPGFDFEFSTTCENCYVFAPIKAFGFELLINAGYAYKARLNLQSDLEMNLDMLATFRGEYHFNYDEKLTDKLQFKIKIPLGPVVVTIQPGMQFFFGFDFDTTIMLEAEARFTKMYTLLLNFDSTKATKEQFTTTLTDRTPEKAIDAHVSGNIDININPMIRAEFWLDCKCYGVSFIEGDLGFKLGLDMYIGAQYPAYPVDNVYSSDYPYYIKLDAQFFVLMNYKVTIFDNVLAQQDEIDILGTHMKYKFAFAKTKTQTSALSFSLPIKSSTLSSLSDLEMATMKYEIGMLSNELGSKKYKVKDIDMYMVNGEKDASRATTSYQYYNFHMLDSKVTYEIVSDIKTCLRGEPCSVPMSETTYPTLTKVMAGVLECQKTECIKCSLDETVCA